MDFGFEAEKLTMKSLVFLALIGAACKKPSKFYLYLIQSTVLINNLNLRTLCDFFGVHSNAYVSIVCHL